MTEDKDKTELSQDSSKQELPQSSSDQELYTDNSLKELESDSKYTLEQKLKVVLEYISTGSIPQAALAADVQISTVYSWKERTVWWPEVVTKLRKEKEDELDGQITYIIDKGIVEILDRIENGDEVFDANGHKRRRKTTLRDLTTSIAILFDKRNIIRNDILGLGKTAPKEEMLTLLKEQMEAFAKKIQNNNSEKVIEGEKIKEPDINN